MPGAHWSALAPAAPLRRWRLIDVPPGELLTAAPLRACERVLHYLAGVSYLDERLRGIVQPVGQPALGDGEDGLSPAQQAAAQEALWYWSRPPQAGVWPVIQLHGDDRAGQAAVAAWVCARLSLGLHTLRAADIPAAAAERETLARLWEREAMLARSALLIDCYELEGEEANRLVAAFIGDLQGLVLLAAREPMPAGARG